MWTRGKGMKLRWQALIFKYLYTFKPGGESAFGSSPWQPHDLQRDVCFKIIPPSTLGQAITCGIPHVETCLFRQLYSCAPSFSHDHFQSINTKPASDPRQSTERQFSLTHRIISQIGSPALSSSSQWPNVSRSANASHTTPPPTDGVS